MKKANIFMFGKMEEESMTAQDVVDAVNWLVDEFGEQSTTKFYHPISKRQVRVNGFDEYEYGYYIPEIGSCNQILLSDEGNIVSVIGMSE